MNQELTNTLFERYPKIFSNRNGDLKESLMFFGFECRDGWFDLIDSLCRNIQNYIDWTNRKSVVVQQIVAIQVKEKFGGLRFYYSGGDDHINGIVSMACAMSTQICEVCGNKGSVRGGGWISTLCDQHAEERNKA